MIKGIAKAVARSYRRKVWWADTRDMEQEAVCEMLRAEPKWDARVGVPQSAYLRRVAVLAVRRLLWKQSAPVSGRGEAELRGLVRAELTDMAETAASPEEEVHERCWRAKVNARLREIIPDMEAEVALTTLMSGETLRTSADELRVPWQFLHQCRRRVRRLIWSDPVLFALWRGR